MRKTVSTYACDGCGEKVETSKQLRRFHLVHQGYGRQRWNTSDNADLCDDCEARLIEATESILGSSVVELRRQEEAPKKPVRQRAKV